MYRNLAIDMAVGTGMKINIYIYFLMKVTYSVIFYHSIRKLGQIPEVTGTFTGSHRDHHSHQEFTPIINLWCLINLILHDV